MPRATAGQNVDWPNFGNDLNNTRFSPLTQVDAGNVSKLGTAWTYNLGVFQVLDETFPQVIGGIMYVTDSTDEVMALDATTGKELWKHASQVDFSLSTGIGGYGVSTNRGVVVANGKVFELTFDNNLVALSEATGEDLWTSSVADAHYGYYESMAPSYYKGLVFVGASGSEDGVRGFVAAYDANTGKKVWQFWTVPAPGTSWVPKGHHGGGGVYMPPTVDTTTGMVYVGTGTPSPVLLGTGRKGANLYTDSILALNAMTGKLIWYYQEVPHDVWNYGAASPVVIFDTTVNGKKVHAVGEAGKEGHFYALNAATGKLLFPPVAYVRVNHPVPTAKGVIECPGTVGGAPYSPISFSPVQHAAYIAGIDLCFKVVVTAKVTGGETDFAGTRTPITKGSFGTFSAVDVTTGKFLWKLKMPSPFIGGSAVTASNLVFSGDQRGNVYAFDAHTGKQLWKVNVGLAIGSAPIMYEVNGKEYIALATGGSATAAAQHLGKVGATIVVFTLNGAPVKPIPQP
jgi:PQQ-dependent dehydrogenase (methanol/ethanol family)